MASVVSCSSLDGCVVSEMQLPGISGLELLRSLRNQEMNVPVITFCPNAACTRKAIVKSDKKGKPVFREVFGNLRAEAWDKAARILSSGMLDKEHNMVMVCTNMYERLETQLCYPRYKFRNGKTLVESKEDLKKPERLGKSPDDADCFVIALWAWDRVPALAEDDDAIKYVDTPTGNPMLMC